MNITLGMLFEIDNNASSAFDEFTKLLYNSSLFNSKPADPFPELIRLIISFKSVEVDSKFLLWN